MQENLSVDLDARTGPVFRQIDHAVKCFAVVVSELWGRKPYIYLPALLFADLLLLSLNVVFCPSCVQHVNTTKNVAYAAASWTVLVSLLSTISGAQVGDWRLALLLCGGPFACAVVVFVVHRARRRLPESATQELHRCADAAIFANTPVKGKIEYITTYAHTKCTFPVAILGSNGFALL